MSSVAEIIFSRIAPGTVQLLSIILLARMLPAEDYGVFSTGLATVGFLANILTGPVQFSIVPRYAASARLGNAQTFESNVLWLLLIMTGAIACLVALASFVGSLDTSWVALAVSAGLVSGWLPVLRARLQFWRYGVAAMTKSLLLLVLVLTSVSAAPGMVSATWAYALSGAAGFVTGWGLCGAPLPRMPDRDSLDHIFRVGASFTGSNIAENGLFLGIRYTVLWFGSSEFLGVFSYAVDLAQRTVGVIINVATFAVVPRAYEFASAGRDAAFRALLLRGGFLAGALSLVAFTCVAAVEEVGLLDRALGAAFSLLAFCTVSVAIVVNRLKKLVLDPFAVHSGMHAIIPLAYGIVAPFAIIASYLSARHGLELGILAIYPAAYLLVATIMAVAIQASIEIK